MAKRLVALIISTVLIFSLCFPMVSNAESQSTAIVQENVLYEDDFTTDTDYITALGNTSWQKNGTPPTVSDGQLISSSDGNKDALLNGLDADSWTDYTVEADITTASAGNTRLNYVAAYGVAGGNIVYGKAYQFTYNGTTSNGTEYFTLVRRGNNNSSTTTWNIGTVKSFLSNFNRGDTIRMSITAITYEDYVNLICKVTYNGVTKEVFNHKDTDTERYTCGMPGFGIRQQNVSLDNVKVAKVKVAKGTVLYTDDFSTDENYTSALGSTTWQSYARPIWEDGKLISGDYTDAKDAKFALLNGLGAESLTNYTVEADITAGTANDRNCYVAIYGRTTDDKQAGSAYQFSYQGKSGKFLLRSNATTASGNKSDLVTDVVISDYFSDYTKGDTIRMSITAITYDDYVNLICKVTYGGETKEVINYNDDREGRYTCGLPGFGLQQQNSSLDNVKVVLLILKQFTNEEIEYVCLDDQEYSVSETGIVMIDGKQKLNGSALTQAGDYTVTVTSNSTEVTGTVALYYKGDTTGDKTKDEIVDIVDLVLLESGTIDENIFTKAGKKAADMDDNGNIEESDVVLLQKMLLAQ